MKFQRKKIASTLAYLLGVGSAVSLIATPVFGQDAGTIKVDVVGSSIKRSLEDQSLPVQIITRDEIARSGVATMEQLVRQIAATASAGAINGASNAGLSTFGQSSVSLRGLGSVRTLILLDGQRMTPFAQELATGVDINSIPLSAIERVEVLTDGASSVYGSDAVAGVINFVLRRNFTGITGGYQYDAPTRSGGGEVNNAWVSAGFGDLVKDKYNVTASCRSEEGRHASRVRPQLLPIGERSAVPGQRSHAERPHRRCISSGQRPEQQQHQCAGPEQPLRHFDHGVRQPGRRFPRLCRDADVRHSGRGELSQHRQELQLRLRAIREPAPEIRNQ